MIVSEIKGLILKYLRDEISGDERRELDAWLAESTDNQLLFEEMTNPQWVAAAMAKMDALHEEEIWQRIQERTVNHRTEGEVETFYPPAREKIRKITRYWAAASIIVLLGAGVIIWRQASTGKRAPVAQTPARDVPPGSNKAVLTLASGQKIILDSARNGSLAQQGGTQVVKTDSGQIAYSGGLEKPTAMLYNTLETPRGGQYQLTLPDGTKVWLNAASSIRYPVAFTGPERTVEVTGEAYLEVTKNASKPFKVILPGNQEVEVLGTNFDVNAYGDEPNIRATLLTGSIRTGGVALKPGQQSAWGAGRPVKVASDADVEEVVAWKNGKFIFSGDDIYSVMRQVARWYDVEVEYKGDFKGVELVGVISRFKNVSEILNMLEQTRTVRFQVQNKKITVLPYKN